ncbi:YihY/virulence factor BrkB family protein [Kineococcus sp. SYSU DK003]|uniref:YihY/virulence factor BrkB family protein n=1 Tax=Kineococcus sp. SYSU DK003 TaxID=3383124 RepID=UPI003D7ED37F
MSAVEQAKSAVSTVQRTVPARAYKKYGDARGNVLAGGIAYFAFFSIFPALAVTLTLVGFVMQNTPELRDWVVRNLVAGVDVYAPGLVHEGATPAGGEDRASGIYIDDYLNNTTLTWALLVSIGTGLFTGIGWIDGMRQGVRAVFGEDSGGGNFALVKLRDVGGLVIIGFGVLLSVASVVATNAAGEFLLDVMGFEPSTWSRWLLAILGFAVAFVFDTLTFLAVFRFLPGADVPVRDLLQGAVLGGVGIGILKQFGTTIASRSADGGGAFVGSAVTLIVLLVLMNLIGRLILLAASLAAVRAEDSGSLNPDLMAAARLVVPLGPEVPEELKAPARRRRGPFVSGVLLGLVGAGAALGLVRRRDH